jgi:hypothetical protein
VTGDVDTAENPRIPADERTTAVLVRVVVDAREALTGVIGAEEADDSIDLAR